ncbi:MAG: magnesium/cobalt transporter CorA [Deltaproteobacteria bacterium]|nr:magnesium/cobalt transporter CorA [Deltaproteobacteria bacterium]
MFRFMKRMSRKAGLPPGTLVHLGDKPTEAVTIRLIQYNSETLVEEDVQDIGACEPEKMPDGITWINIDGTHQVEVIEKMGRHLGLHPLTLEDMVNGYQRPKLEEFENYIFLTLKMLSYDTEKNELGMENASLVIGADYVLSVHEKAGHVFAPIRERLRKARGRIRKKGVDYLYYALIDAIVDNYFGVLEKMGEEIERLEEELLENPGTPTLQQIHDIKRELIFLRKSVWPLREVISALKREDSGLIQETTRIYLQDVYDHTIQVMDTVETFRDMVSSMLDIYLSMVSNRMNEVMKVLTIMASIFIPLTFIAGIYGMNFEIMPELKWPWGYPMVWAVVVLIGGVMVL